MNLEDKKNLVIQLHQEGKTQREIAKSAHMSVRDISRIIRKVDGIADEKSVETKVLYLFYQGKKPIEVAVDLNLNASKISKLYKDYLKLEGFHKMVSVYEEINGNLNLFLKLYYEVIYHNIKIHEIVNLVKNSNELVDLKIAIQLKRNELYLIERNIKQHQAQITMGFLYF
jgi:DNA-binding CsgD family transcriptional regulator